MVYKLPSIGDSVTMISETAVRVGENYPEVALFITEEIDDGSISVHVNVSRGTIPPVEKVRFCARSKGGTSPDVHRCLDLLWKNLGYDTLDNAVAFDFYGENGEVHLSVGKDGSDYYIKTTNLEVEVYGGATVLFPLGHKHYKSMSNLRKAMVYDQMQYPLPIPKK